MKKLDLKANCPMSITMVPPENVTVEWRYDARFRPVIQEETPEKLTLLYEGADEIMPGFYAVFAVLKHTATGKEIRREEYLVRIATDTDRISMSQHISRTGAAPLAPHSSSPVSGADVPATAAGDSINITLPRITPAMQSPMAEEFVHAKATGDAAPSRPVGVPDGLEDSAPFDGASLSPNANKPEPESDTSLYPEMQGEYCLVLRRNGVDVAGTETVISKGATTTVGREAGCTLSLAGQFLSHEGAKKCSRRQMEAFWQGARICVKNTGKNSISVKTTSIHKLEQAGWCYWQADAEIILPGDLSLRLRRTQP